MWIFPKLGAQGPQKHLAAPADRALLSPDPQPEKHGKEEQQHILAITLLHCHLSHAEQPFN